MTDPTPTESLSAETGAVKCEDGLIRPSWAVRDITLRNYYDSEWGMPIRDERGLYERLTLESFQSGLSWATILHKRPAFREVFYNFDPEIVAKFTESDIARLMQEIRIIRNYKKITAAINNAQATLALREIGGLADFIWSFQPHTSPEPKCLSDIPSQSAESIALSQALRKQGFKFVGPTTMFALMEAIGMVDTHLISSHRRGSSGIWPR